MRIVPTTSLERDERCPVTNEAIGVDNGGVMVKWNCTISSSAPLLGDTGLDLEIVIIDLYSGLHSPINCAHAWLPPQLTQSKSGAQGWARDGPISVPVGLHAPGAVLIRKHSAAQSVDYISSVVLVNSTASFRVPVESWVSSAHGWRVFFGAAACLPKDTPPSLVDERARDLAQLQGTPKTRKEERSGADRIYWYQTYDDLGKPGTFRPALGGSKQLPYPRRLATNRGTQPDGSENPPAAGEKPWLPFDEQFSFNKAKGFYGGQLTGALTAAFSIIGEAGNNSHLTLTNLLPTAVRGVANVLLGLLPFSRSNPLKDYEDFADVLAMFKLDADNTETGFPGIKPDSLYPKDAARGLAAAVRLGSSPATPFKRADGAWDFRLGKREAEKVNLLTAVQRVGPVYDSATGTPAAGVRRSKGQHGGEPPQPGAPAIAARLGGDLWSEVQAGAGDVNDLLYFTVPRLIEGRPEAWYTDEEFGRQLLAGFNPCGITALKQTPESLGSAIRGEHVNDDLQGSSLEALVAEAAAGAQPRLYWVDYWDLDAFWSPEDQAADEAQLEKKGRVQHQGRALVYLRKDDAGNDAALIPVAIELAGPITRTQHPELPPSAGLVYCRSQLAADPGRLAVWRLAKAVFRSLDFSVHEVYQHFTRSHAVMEPFLIALRRQLSTLHPVFRLMLPHFRYTLEINRNARSNLIQAGGIIESCFSPGESAMPLGAVQYGKTWTFAGQALPADLQARGMLGPDGKPWLDYPFAADGLDLWAALESYFRSYLELYYSGESDVRGDSELQAWWAEVKNEGHPDLVAFGLRSEEEVWGFAGPIPSLDRLVTVLTTIAWIGSGHHAAVNFGQYDYTSLILNVSSLVRRQMPAPGQKAYTDLVTAPPGSPQERQLLTYLADPLSAVKVIATVQLLSAHAEDEHTLDLANTFLTEPAAIAANASFISAVKKLDATIASRNADPTNWARYCLAGGCNDPLPYTLLQPSSGTGVTMRGVPYSVSI